MNIIHILPTLQGGGIMNFLYSLTPEQVNLGNKVSIIVTDKEFKNYSDERADLLRKMGVDVYFLNRIISNKISTISTIVKCRKLINKLKPDIVNTHTSICHVFGSLATKYTRFVHCCTIHSAPESWSRSTKLLIGSKPLIYCSDAALELRGQEGKPMVAINNGVDTKLIRTTDIVDLKKELNIPNDHKVVVLLGSQRPPKNYPFLIKIVETLKDETIHFCICGGNNKVASAGSKYNSGYISISQFEAYKNIHLLDLRNDVPAVLNGSDVYLSCSIREGLPISALEAFFSGIPCVLSPIVQHTNIARGISECYVPDSFDEASFINCLYQALNSGKSHDDIFAEREEQLKVFQIDRCAKEYQEFYAQIIDEKK